jgi:hypothetical protein
MTCSTVLIAVCVPVPAFGFPLVSASKPGPRSRRTRSFSQGLSGPVTRTETNWTNDSLSDIELLAWHQDQLVAELAKRRKAHKATCSVLADLQGVVNAILAMRAK